MRKWIIILLIPVMAFVEKKDTQTWIRINQLGYTPGGLKVAVWCSKKNGDSIWKSVNAWQLVDAETKKIVASGKPGKPFGAYGPFMQSYRFNFSAFKKPGRYYLQAGETKSPEFEIGDDVYKGAADFCLRYMRQQRTGFNPYLKDSCHTHDGYVLYGQLAGIADSARVDVVGGWHDASDYLQYVTTSANAAYHLLMAHRDFSKVFTDQHQSNGLVGKNGLPDVLDEAKWGLDWLLKMHPKKDWMFNQIADDRDHMGMRMPKQDNFYGRGFERPVYYVSGEPQQRGKFMNNTTGTSSTAGKFASAFALGAELFYDNDSIYAKALFEKALSAFVFGTKKWGVSQTASVKSPYIYAEENWKDDMELALASLSSFNNSKPQGNKFIQDQLNLPGNASLTKMAMDWANDEPLTPWQGADTAKHYQWYPFINIGHYELAKQLTGSQKNTIAGYYKEGIRRVWNKAKSNAFYRGIPYIWCSNNLTASFTIQCYWYRKLTGDQEFSELEQANFDWLFGCNPWGSSMVYGLPSWGDTPVDPHSSFTHLKNYPIDGGLVDGPVYGSIYNNLIGIRLYQPDEYAGFQSNLAVYHDDYGDYSTNEPTMDGTASLVYLLAAKEAEVSYPKEKASGILLKEFPFKSAKSSSRGKREKINQEKMQRLFGAVVRGDTIQKKIALVFTGDEFADGGEIIAETLQEQKIKASFFLTGRFYSNPNFSKIVNRLKKDAHYLGPHSNNHLLYCDWSKRDSLLITKEEFSFDLLANLDIMNRQGISKSKTKYFLPPYEWYNDSIASWTKQLGLQLISFTPGTKSVADYTYPGLKNYQSAEVIYTSIINHAESKPSGLNGFILLLHIGTDPRRIDKFYRRLPELIKYLSGKGYQFQRVDQLLNLD